MLLPKIIGRFKMNAGKEINSMRQTTGQTVWQRNYFEHIIRNAESYKNIENYIRNNPANWMKDGKGKDDINEDDTFEDGSSKDDISTGGSSPDDLSQGDSSQLDSSKGDS
jgi:hypothetical protein